MILSFGTEFYMPDMSYPKPIVLYILYLQFTLIPLYRVLSFNNGLKDNVHTKCYVKRFNLLRIKLRVILNVV